MICGIISVACGLHGRKFVNCGKDIWNDWRRSSNYCGGRCAILRKEINWWWKFCFRSHRTDKEVRSEKLLFIFIFIFGKLDFRRGEGEGGGGREGVGG